MQQHWCNLAAKESGLECACVNNVDFTGLVSGGGRQSWVSMCAVWPSPSKWLTEYSNKSEYRFCIKLEHSSVETILMIRKAAAMGNWWLAASSWQHTLSCIKSYTEFFGETSNHPLDSVPLQPRFGLLAQKFYNFWLFPKLKSPLKGKISDHWWDSGKYDRAHWMAIGRTVWGPKVLLWRGLRYHCPMHSVSCILYLLQ